MEGLLSTGLTPSSLLSTIPSVGYLMSLNRGLICDQLDISRSIASLKIFIASSSPQPRECDLADQYFLLSLAMGQVLVSVA